MMSDRDRILTGNEACVLGALEAGMDFFAGYPITPAMEIAEVSSVLLPRYGGKYIQMEDELGSIAAVIGASAAGAKSMTATSGPGFSLMQENIGYAMLAEIPCVIVDVMRQGPCQGVATVPSQGDLMQVRWGTHGDHPVIAVAPCFVKEVYYETIRAFSMAERFRMPVFIVSDAMLAHMSEKVRLPEKEKQKPVTRKLPLVPPEQYLPYADDGTGVPPMAVFGDGYRWYATGLIHNERGIPVSDQPQVIEEELSRIHRKVMEHLDEIESWEEYKTEDADLIIVSVGVVSRSVKCAVDRARNEGIKAGAFRPITLWPFPEKRLLELAKGHGRIIMSCEMNQGQLAEQVKRVAGTNTRVYSVTQNNGKIPSVNTILAAIREVAGDGGI